MQFGLNAFKNLFENRMDFLSDFESILATIIEPESIPKAIQNHFLCERWESFWHDTWKKHEANNASKNE